MDKHYEEKTMQERKRIMGEERLVRFYTLPPWDIEYPYVLINNQHPEYGLRYLIRYNKRSVVESVIIDSGVEVFRDKRVKDYPGGFKVHIRRQVSLYEKLKKILPHAEIYVTVPDYPDDYNPGNLWLSEEKTNIERTVESIMHAVEHYPNVEWLIPLQGHYKRPRTLLRMLELLDKHGFQFRQTLYGLANLCVERRCDIVEFSVRYVYHWFLEQVGYKPRLHLFGPKLNCLRRVREYIFSFDSMAWTRPVNSELHINYPWSAKTSYERNLFFKTYLKRIEEITRMSR